MTFPSKFLAPQCHFWKIFVKILQRLGGTLFAYFHRRGKSVRQHGGEQIIVQVLPFFPSQFVSVRSGRTAAERGPAKSSAKLSRAREFFPPPQPKTCAKNGFFPVRNQKIQSFLFSDVVAWDREFSPSVTENVCKKRILPRP